MQTKILTVDDILTYKDIYFETLAHLTSAPLMSDKDIITHYNQATLSGSYFFGCFDDEGELMWVGTLFLDYKFIRGGSCAWHIEDVVTRPGYEGKWVGKMLIQIMIKKAEELGCYKTILDCHENLIPFYEKTGFYLSGVQMRRDNIDRK